MKKIVCKFGGSSVADAAQVEKVVSIVRSDERRCLVVPSAPGKRFEDDTKITDLLYLCHELARQNVDFSEPFNKISTRFLDLSKSLSVSIDMEKLLAEIKSEIADGAVRDYVASRGE